MPEQSTEWWARRRRKRNDGVARFPTHYDAIPHGNCNDPARCDCECNGCMRDYHHWLSEPGPVAPKLSEEGTICAISHRLDSKRRAAAIHGAERRVIEAAKEWRRSIVDTGTEDELAAGVRALEDAER